MRLLRAFERQERPWKNGGGVTTEVAAFPDGASLEAFDWRVSLATVASDGPFSIFQGIDRTLTVLSGHGIDLDFEGAVTQRLDRGSEPFSFPGDVAVLARLVEGPIEDFNVMTRRGVVEHHVLRHRLKPDRPMPLDLPAGLVFVTGACRVAGFDLEPRDALLVEEPTNGFVLALQQTDLFRVAIRWVAD